MLIGITLDLHPLIFILLYLILVLGVYIFYYLKKRPSQKKFFIMLAFIFYCLVLFKLTILPITILFEDQGDYSYLYYQIIPFASISKFASSNLKLFIIQVLGNFLLLIPLPIFYNILINDKRKTTLKKNIILIIFTSLFIEVTQLCINKLTKVPNKVADIDDLMLNILGGIFGYLMFYLIQKFKNKYLTHHTK